MKQILILLVLGLSFFQVQAQTEGSLDYIESGVTLRLSSPIQPDGARKIYLTFQTNDVYECADLPINFDPIIEGNKLTVKVKGVKMLKNCEPGMAPAKGILDITKLKDGKYRTRFSINRQIFKAKLFITPDFIEFVIDEKEDPSLFRIYNSRLNLIPEGIIWGRCEYSDPKMKEESKKFMGELERAGCLRTMLPVGSYDDFYLHQPGITEQRVISGDIYEYPFVYAYTGDILVLKEIATAFKGKLNITIKDLKGQVITNF